MLPDCPAICTRPSASGLCLSKIATNTPSSARGVLICACISACGRTCPRACSLSIASPWSNIVSPLTRPSALLREDMRSRAPANMPIHPQHDCRTGIEPPDLYATKETCPNEGDRKEYNSIQRAHHNVQEYEPIFLTMLVSPQGAHGMAACALLLLDVLTVPQASCLNHMVCQLAARSRGARAHRRDCMRCTVDK